MDTNRLKRFATEARNILMQGVAHRLSALGFLPDGSVTEEPQQQGGGATFMGDTVTQDFFDKWQSLHRAVTERSVEEVAEEAAYTWFNRLVAIRILVKNGLASPVLEYESEDVLVPLLVSEARQGRLPEMDADSLRKLTALLEDDSKTNEQFALLIVAYCHGNPIINKCFGRISDYTELLLPSNILTEGGFVYLLNHTEFIAEEDFRSPELIGWLYQFYISERKDEVFAKKGKFEADEIPAATQIFTPNWIVKYMVQNTVGRIYLDNNPYETELQEKWKYLVEPSPAAKPIINSQPAAKPIINSQPAAKPIINSQPAAKPIINSKLYIINYSDLEELKVGDLACGSGHILNECFDLLYDLYIAEGYGRGKAIENIFRHNLTGVDLDTRAKQLATFSLLLKACQKDNAFADGHCLPRVLDMPEPEDSLNHFFGVFMHDMGEHSHALLEAVKLCNQARDLGSIMKFDITEQDRKDLAFCIERWEQEHETHELNHNANDVAIAKLILALTEKYHALVMNPPYMGGGNMNATLSKYVKEEYEEGKADLFSVFMRLAIDRLLPNGKYGMINMQSWMFLSSFEKLRTRLLTENRIDNMLHLGPRTFDELSGEVVQNTAFVITNCEGKDATGSYYRLVDGKSCEDKERMFLEAQENGGNRIYYPNVSQQDFEKIPGAPIGYWVSDKVKEIFTSNLALSAVCSPTQGLATADNARFLRLWCEVSQSRIGFGCDCAASAAQSRKKWFPYNKGGSARKWYGNQELVVNWENDGQEIRNFKGAVIRNPSYYFRPSIAWSLTSSVGNAFRYFPQGFIFDVNGMSLFTDNIGMLAYLNTKMCGKFLSIINPTLACQIGNVASLPFCHIDNNVEKELVQQNISISKQDWDAHETSWDFEENPLLAVDEETYIDNIHHEIERHEKETGERICIDPAAPKLDNLEWRMEQYKKKWEHLFKQLHENEEELNRQFIDIYGLQDELTPDVPLDEITILQQGEIWLAPCPGSDSLYGAAIVWNDYVVMKQFICYAVGCMMGRYRLDKKGLHIAHPNPTAEETAPYIYNNVKFEIDEDGIIPLMPNDCDFSDNASNRFADFVRIALGDAKHVENLNFVEKCLGKSVEQYFVKDFWKDHKKMYQNRPIYWLFASKKGAFQCIAYMHRMNAYTAERIRTKYLLPHIEWLMQKQNEMEENAANLSTAERRKLDSIRKQIDECREYHDRLHVIADEQIAFDLDDGVVVNYAKFGDVLSKLK